MNFFPYCISPAPFFLFVVMVTYTCANPLNAELNPIYHLLLLLGDLTFMGPCIVSIFQYISNKMQRYTIYLYLQTSLPVSGGTSTHHQERIQLYLQHLIFVTPLLLSAAIVEELEQV
jgi:membrane protease YdiL (CAAX protease family)